MNRYRFWNLLAKKLSGEAGPEELAELEKLMKDHPDWIFSAEHIEDLWKLKTIPEDPHESELAFDLHLKHITKDRDGLNPTDAQGVIRKRRITKLLLLPIFVFLFFAAALYWKFFSMNPTAVAEKNFSEVSTRPGS